MQLLRKKMKRVPTVLLSIMLLTGHVTVFAETAESASQSGHHEHNRNDWPGIYYGFLPCDDCAGVKTTLALNQNNSYILITQFTGKSDREFTEKGKFTWTDKDNTILLTPRKGSETHQYLVDKDVLIHLDKTGNRVTGKLADRYILRRTDVTTEKSEPSHAH